ncbi:carboxypeptidase-like regulatory domain-containing protein [Ornithinimicrobium sp. F0845]|uniref:carboxypeptidase-like regulatory domain-containing protein n=1 Tax=Ornithinimicrobium sp. F0845 TaxID=2926412 RepID=UPI001FF54FB1|nr:carboxypeptidase-like regulatory domain-containing protein [Ornithinimicrobium sp. F0845]MCK0112109.1 carboxypeptidase-like regulatory domain-containing protein [Ornithinimicrobium sp. F0845]
MIPRTWRSGAALLLAATLLTACTGEVPAVTDPTAPPAPVDGAASAPAAGEGAAGEGAAGQGADGEAGGPLGDPVAAEGSDGEVEPYIVKGRVLDSQGRPVPGVSVLANNTMLYGSTAEAVTDADGSYRIDLSLLETTWRMWGTHEVAFDGQRYSFQLDVDETPFASHDGAVRDFVWRIGGPMESHPDLFHGGAGHVYQDYGSGGLEDITLVTLHFTPSGPLADGTAGEPLDVPVDGLGAFGGIPLGRYTITATYGPPGAEHNLLIQDAASDDEASYAESVESGFEPDLWGGTLAVRVRLP